MYNPQLVEELENKLPDDLKSMWSIHKQGLKSSRKCTLKNVSNWLIDNDNALNGDINFEKDARSEAR